MFLERLIKFFASLRLTVTCLSFGMVLIFTGTLAQVPMGLYKAQNEFFRSFFVYWQPEHFAWKIPVLPGGYLLGGVLLLNLIAAHSQRFSFSRKKAGIWMIHAGLILLLLGQLFTDMLAQESQLHLRVGDVRNYSESDREFELAITDITDKDADKVVAIPERFLLRQGVIKNDELPFAVRVNKFYVNTAVTNHAAAGYEAAGASLGFGATGVYLKAIPRETRMDLRDLPSGIIEIVTPSGSAGSFMVSAYFGEAQQFSLAGRTYTLMLRMERFYKPYSLRLEEFKHDVYKGTDVPKNFSSRLVLDRPETGEHREVLIYMNNPLRYDGETYYQASFDQDDGGTVLQVVHNPSWITPYLACLLVGAGLIVQFLSHLVPFLQRRRTA
jgi:hypothetical protein